MTNFEVAEAIRDALQMSQRGARRPLAKYDRSRSAIVTSHGGRRLSSKSWRHNKVGPAAGVSKWIQPEGVVTSETSTVLPVLSTTTKERAARHRATLDR